MLKNHFPWDQLSDFFVFSLEYFSMNCLSNSNKEFDFVKKTWMSGGVVTFHIVWLYEKNADFHCKLFWSNLTPLLGLYLTKGHNSVMQFD